MVLGCAVGSLAAGRCARIHTVEIFASLIRWAVVVGSAISTDATNVWIASISGWASAGGSVAGVLALGVLTTRVVGGAGI